MTIHEMLVTISFTTERFLWRNDKNKQLQFNVLNLSMTWSFRIHSNMMIWCSRNIQYYYQCWKQLCCHHTDPKLSNTSLLFVI